MQLYSLKNWSSILLHVFGFTSFYLAGFLTCYLDNKMELHRQQLEVYELRLQVEQNKADILKLTQFMETVKSLQDSNQDLIKANQTLVKQLSELKHE
jgi:hypothetical protein